MIRLLAATAATLVAAQLAVVPHAGASPAAPQHRDYHQPVVGSCYPGLDAGAASDRDAPVPCDRTHRLQTIAAPLVPSGFDWSDQDAVYNLAERQCRTAEYAYLGSQVKVDQSAYTYLFFVPTKAELAHGASWIRCDLGRRGGQQLLPLAPRIRPLGDLPLPARFARCLDTRAGLGTACTRKHDFRAIGVRRVGGTSYPDEKTWIQIGLTACPRMAKKQGWDRDNWTYPSKYGWNQAHQRLLVCYGGHRTQA